METLSICLVFLDLLDGLKRTRVGWKLNSATCISFVQTLFEANQGGMETLFQIYRNSIFHLCLKRTKVGWKPTNKFRSRNLSTMFEANQGGMETRLFQRQPRCLLRLKRTKVGWKLIKSTCFPAGTYPFEANQGGMETDVDMVLVYCFLWRLKRTKVGWKPSG